MSPGGAQVVEAVVIERDGMMLRVDPVSLEALRAARADGGSPADFGALPSIEELPLRVLAIETRLAMLEARDGG